jgi:microcystin-dependent protein
MDPFLAEIRLFSFDRIPRGWLPCEGQLLSIQQNSALFALLGTTYGGNGVNNFMLPDLRGRLPLHINTDYPLGNVGGEAAHVLTSNEMPQHMHLVSGSSVAPTSAAITGNIWGQQTSSFGPPDAPVAMSPAAISTAGGSQPHPNMQPYLAMSYCIATQGIFPPRN